MTARDIAVESGIGLETVYELLDGGALEYFMAGTRRYVKRPVYERWLRGAAA
jgi:hypothetical protein